MTWTWPGHKSPLAQKALRVIVRQREAAVRAPGMLQQHSSRAAITSAIRAMVAAWRKSIGHLPSAILRPHEVGEGSARDHAAICSCCSFHAACFVSGSFLSVFAGTAALLYAERARVGLWPLLGRSSGSRTSLGPSIARVRAAQQLRAPKLVSPARRSKWESSSALLALDPSRPDPWGWFSAPEIDCNEKSKRA